MSNTQAASGNVPPASSHLGEPCSNPDQVTTAPAKVGSKWESVISGKNQEAQILILESGVDISAVMDFGLLSYIDRLAILSAVRRLDSPFRQKSVPVLIVFLVYILGALAVVGNVDGHFYGSLVGAVIVLGASICVARVGRRDAVKESNHAAWLNALESVDAEATKRESLSKK